MPKDYDNLYNELKGKFECEISQNEDSVIQQVCNICVYLDGLNSKGIKVNFPFWGEIRFGSSATFPYKLFHFRGILSHFLTTLDNKSTDNCVFQICNLLPESKEFNAVVTGGSRFKVSEQYKRLVIELIDAVSRLESKGKKDCLQKCKEFVDEQFSDALVTNSNHPNCSI